MSDLDAGSSWRWLVVSEEQLMCLQRYAELQVNSLQYPHHQHKQSHRFPFKFATKLHIDALKVQEKQMLYRQIQQFCLN